MQFLRKRGGFAMLSAVLLMAFSPLSWAHAKLGKSTPAADSVLKESPKDVRLEFNEKLETMFSSMTVRDIQGKTISVAKSVIDSSDQKVMTLVLPSLTPGRYEVKWTVVTVDGHRVMGGYMFSIAK